MLWDEVERHYSSCKSLLLLDNSSRAFSSEYFSWVKRDALGGIENGFFLVEGGDLQMNHSCTKCGSLLHTWTLTVLQVYIIAITCTAPLDMY